MSFSEGGLEAVAVDDVVVALVLVLTPWSSGASRFALPDLERWVERTVSGVVDASVDVEPWGWRWDRARGGHPQLRAVSWLTFRYRGGRQIRFRRKMRLQRLRVPRDRCGRYGGHSFRRYSVVRS